MLFYYFMRINLYKQLMREQKWCAAQGIYNKLWNG